MTDNKIKKYCLDSNVLIEAWRKYYSPDYCGDYWEILSYLGDNNIIFIPQMVFNELTNYDDKLADWIKISKIHPHKITEKVNKCLTDMYANNPKHKNLVDIKRQKSIADPWVVAHAIAEEACVVTKEIFLTAINTDKVRIPNVCKNMGIQCINDFEFIKEVNIKFNCKIA